MNARVGDDPADALAREEPDAIAEGPASDGGDPDWRHAAAQTRVDLVDRLFNRHFHATWFGSAADLWQRACAFRDALKQALTD